MKRTIWISTVREIKQSMGRFLAILAIVALGVAFFAGLTIAKSEMVATGEKYLKDHAFYDYRILSTAGLREEELELLEEKEEVQAVEGAISFDIMYLDEAGNNSVLKAHSITEQANRLELVKGRMPQAPNECVVDSLLWDKSGIGRKIKLSSNNTEEDRDRFAYEEYTVVGIVQSPLYIQFERGSTSLGSGVVSGFFYIPREGFEMDYYTEAYVKFSEEFALYSDGYQEYIDAKQPLWEEYAEDIAYSSYEGILADGWEQLADAKEELASKKAEAEAELADAKQKLDDAKTELEDGEKQLADAKKELEDARKTIEKNEKDLLKAEEELPRKEKELEDGEKEWEQGLAEWNAGKTILSQSKIELLMAQVKLEEQKSLLTENESMLLMGETLLQQTENSLLATKQSLEAQQQNLDAREEALNDLYGEGNVPEEMLASINRQREQNAADLQAVEAELAELEPQKAELAAGKEALAQGKRTIASYEKQLSDGMAQIIAGEKELEKGKLELEEAEKKIAEGKRALEEGKIQISDGKNQLEDAKEELAEGEATLLEKEQEFLDGKQEYEDGLKEYEEGLAEFHEEIADAEDKIAKAEEDLAELEEPDSYVLGRDTNVGYVCFENDSAIIEGIAKVFPVFFFLVAALVCITTMNRMVEEQRTQIGVLKALGYRESTIMSKYMFYSGTAAIAGCIIGYFGGTFLFPNVIWYAYGIMYSMSPLLYLFDGKLALISFVVSVICSMGATWFSCRVELSEVAAQLMRPKSPKAGKRIFLEYIPFIWKRLSFLSKVSIRNIIRYKKRLFMMVMGISGCTALLITGFGVKDSISNVVTKQYEDVQKYDIGIALKDSYTEPMGERIAEVTGLSHDAYVPASENAYDLVTEDGRKGLTLVVFDSKEDMTPFVGLQTVEKNPLPFPEMGEVVLSNKLANTFRIQVGDIITLQNEDMQVITATVSGICENHISNYAYICGETYKQQIRKEAKYKSVYLKLPSETDRHQIAATLMKEDGVVSVNVNNDMVERLNSMMKSLDLIVVVIILCAGGLAFIVLYNLTNINITERIREIATIRVLGFNKKETESYIFNENMVLVGVGALVGMVLGYYLHGFVMGEVSIDLISFDVHIRPISYGYSVLLTFIFAWLINRIMGSKLEQISMTESLKSVD